MNSLVASIERNPFDELDAVVRLAVLRQRNHRAYELYLRSESWKAIRTEAIKRARGACEDCERSFLVLLDVHHMTYVRLGAERLDDVRVLCRPCHEKRHGR